MQPIIVGRRLPSYWSVWKAAIGVVVAAALAWPSANTAAPPMPSAGKWVPLFNGKDLDHWGVIGKYDFKRHGKVHVDDGRLVLEAGQPGTGIRWKGRFPRMNYEVAVDAARIRGDDFFCGMTFPVGDKALTLVVGGWGGPVTGLSCIDDEPAVENETCQYIDFEQGRWYHIRVKVTPSRIEVWLDKKKIIDFEMAHRELTLYWAVEPCLPFGIATWRTTGGLRNLRVRTLTDGSSRRPTRPRSAPAH